MACTCRIRKGRSLLFSGKECHLVLLGHFLYCYPVNNNKTPFSELDLSFQAQLSVSNSTTFSIKDQTWTTYSFQAANTEDRNVWLSALRCVEGLRMCVLPSLSASLPACQCGAWHQHQSVVAYCDLTCPASVELAVCTVICTAQSLHLTAVHRE